MIELKKGKYYQFFGNGNTYQFIEKTKTKYIFDNMDFVNWNPLLDNSIVFKEKYIQFLIECEKPKVGYTEYYFDYNEYSDYEKQLAKEYSIKDLQKVVKTNNFNSIGLRNSNINAIKKTTSMQSNSQARAMSEIALNCNSQTIQSYINAIKIKYYYPNQ